MIDINTKIHDNYSIEFKLGFLTRRKLKLNDFSVYMWIFVPGSLDITSSTYPKSKFYQDVKSNVRLITPKFLLREIAGGKAVPLNKLKESFNNLAITPTRTMTAEYENNIKMFAAITKSAVRDEFKHICSNRVRPDDREGLCERFVQNCDELLEGYRGLHSIIDTPSVNAATMKYYYYADEFIGSIVQNHIVKLVQWLNSQEGDHSAVIAKLTELYYKEQEYRKKMKYPVLELNDPLHNRNIVFRFGMLKKYIESDLYVKVPKKKNGVLVEQLYYSIAAGLAMLFATVVSFAFQKTYGSLTLPLFIALIISYMLKDRIKELMRYYFAHRIGTKYFDNKASIFVKDEKIGFLKEGVDFIPPEKLPEKVKEVRYNKRLLSVENRLSDDKTILYRKLVHINREKLESLTPYETAGINDIIRLNVNSFLRKMDNAAVTMESLTETGEVLQIPCDKVYYINIILQTNWDETGRGSLVVKNKHLKSDYQRFRVALTRNGIDSIEEIK